MPSLTGGCSGPGFGVPSEHRRRHAGHVQRVAVVRVLPVVRQVDVGQVQQRRRLDVPGRVRRARPQQEERDRPHGAPVGQPREDRLLLDPRRRLAPPAVQPADQQEHPLEVVAGLVQLEHAHALDHDDAELVGRVGLLVHLVQAHLRQLAHAAHGAVHDVEDALGGVQRQVRARRLGGLHRLLDRRDGVVDQHPGAPHRQHLAQARVGEGVQGAPEQVDVGGQRLGGFRQVGDRRPAEHHPAEPVHAAAGHVVEEGAGLVVGVFGGEAAARGLVAHERRQVDHPGGLDRVAARHAVAHALPARGHLVCIRPRAGRRQPSIAARQVLAAPDRADCLPPSSARLRKRADLGQQR